MPEEIRDYGIRRAREERDMLTSCKLNEAEVRPSDNPWRLTSILAYAIGSGEYSGSTSTTLSPLSVTLLPLQSYLGA